MENNYYYTKAKDGTVYRYTIGYDEYPTNPRDEYDNVVTLYMWWGNLGDVNGDVDDTLRKLCDKYLPDYDYEDSSTRDMMISLQTKASDKLLIRPIYVYEHSGITISLGNEYPYNDRWDGGLGGFAVVERETIEEMGGEWKDAYAIIEGEVKAYDLYLGGECYGYWTDTYVGDGEWEEGEYYEGGFLSDKWGDELAREMIGELITEEEAKEAMKLYDAAQLAKANYGLWMMAQ